jgi:acetylornithine aminotransferase
LDKPNAKDFAAKMAKAGVLVNAANESTIRIAPALIVTQAQLVKFVSIFRKVISDGK